MASITGFEPAGGGPEGVGGERLGCGDAALAVLRRRLAAEELAADVKADSGVADRAAARALADAEAAIDALFAAGVDPADSRDAVIWIEEVERLRPHLGATAVRALGYQQIIDLLDGIWDVNDAFADIAQKTKRLARKQMGWFGRDPRIHWLQALNPKLVDNAMAIIAHADAGDYDPIDARADEYTQHHLGDITA